MFRSLRWRLTFWFVILTTVVYVLSAMFAAYLFREALTGVIEDELEALMSEIEPAIKLHDGKPTLHEWAETSLAVPFKFLPTIQIYDASDRLIERYGPRGIQQLYKDGGELKQGQHFVRIYSTPLAVSGKLVGYLQLQVNLRSRDHAVSTFVNTLTGVSPYLIVSLIISGYVFSTLAAQPVEDSFHVLRRFMSDAGHELGTPIAIIQANAEAMEPDLPQSEAITNRLSVIARSTERLGTLVQDLMLLSKMESPQLQQKKVPIELDKLVAGLLEEFDAVFSGKEITLIHGKLQPATIVGEPESIKRLIMNLLQNALRYTEGGGSVTVNEEVSGRNAKLTVTDTGVGIPEESLPLIFDRFYRVEKSRTRAAGGAGLGLSIVKAIVDIHKGKIEVSSKVGTGTTFTILLPLHK
ncbi:MAG TPA: HAMP domain-containing sensor histidine kinase [Planktothrix sp.]|jgi:signal transduction histidine kinase